MEIQTIQIKSDTELGFRYINYDEFDQDTQELYGVEVKEKATQKTKVNRPVTED